MSIFNTVFQRLQCLLMGGTATNAEVADVAEKLLTYTISIPIAASADASTALAESAWIPIPAAGRVKSVRMTQSGAGTANASNYAVVNLIKRDPTGTTSATVATRATSTTGLAQYSGTGATAFTITEANAAVEAGGSLSLSITKAGTGLSTTAGIVLVTIQRTD
jgi:hypothetical protein